jgi:hypothetical protein
MSSTSAAVANNKLETSISMEGYVVIQQPDDIRDDDVSLGGAHGGGDDDASYDYCEDVFSHGEPEADDLDDDHSVDLSIGSGSGPHKGNIILTVPSILMKDLDEAHAAAELASVPDLSEENEASLPRGEDSPAQEPSDKERASQSVPTTTVNEKPANKVPAATSGSKSKSPGRTDEQDSSSSVPGTCLSRASNKKRRKKLKLTKKALAAETAVQALSGGATDTAVNGKASKTKKKVVSHASTTHGTSRKVANLAVACARETMTSYRQEVLCSTMG